MAVSDQSIKLALVGLSVLIRGPHWDPGKAVKSQRRRNFPQTPGCKNNFITALYIVPRISSVLVILRKKKREKVRQKFPVLKKI